MFGSPRLAYLLVEWLAALRFISTNKHPTLGLPACSPQPGCLSIAGEREAACELDVYRPKASPSRLHSGTDASNSDTTGASGISAGSLLLVTVVASGAVPVALATLSTSSSAEAFVLSISAWVSVYWPV